LSLELSAFLRGSVSRNAPLDFHQGFFCNPKLIKKVNYPGLENHPDFQIAAKQMKAFGGMLSFELDDQRVSPVEFLKKLNLIKPALSLGGVETIICAPVATSHEKMSDAERAELGITNSLLRLSVGIEDSDDLIADIEQALE
jgi:cystathionine beta-lyase